MEELEDHRAIVTGGASGIGFAVAARLRASGACVALLDIDGDRLREAASKLDCDAFEVDVANSQDAKDAVVAATAALSGLSILVNNAGAGHLSDFHQYSDADWNRLIAVNLSGTFHVMRAAIPLMLEGGGGAIVNNASCSGMRPTRGELPYSAAKAGVIALTQGAAQEYGPEIRVNCVSPGVIRTPMSEALFHIEGALDPVLRATPLARTGTAEEVADVIAFLCSNSSRFVTGQNLVIDGGLGLAQAGIDETLRSLLDRMRRG